MSSLVGRTFFFDHLLLLVLRRTSKRKTRKYDPQPEQHDHNEMPCEYIKIRYFPQLKLWIITKVLRHRTCRRCIYCNQFGFSINPILYASHSKCKFFSFGFRFHLEIYSFNLKKGKTIIFPCFLESKIEFCHCIDTQPSRENKRKFHGMTNPSAMHTQENREKCVWTLVPLNA